MSRHRLLEKDKGIEIAGWVVSQTNGTISSSKAVDDFYAETKVRCPEMVFLSNNLRLQCPERGGFMLEFNATEPLSLTATASSSSCAGGAGKVEEGKVCEPGKASSTSPSPSSSSSASTIQVAMASKWDSDKIKQVESTFDWTYSSYYHGTFRLFQGARASPAALQRVEEPNGLDMQLLTRPDPILWYADIPLFEDELHDNGTSALSVKIRVMPTFWLVLLRFFLRVDGVLIRLRDTRVFHKFGTDHIVSEFQEKELSNAELQQRKWPLDPSFYSDPNKVSQKFPTLRSHRHRIALPPLDRPALAAPGMTPRVAAPHS